MIKQMNLTLLKKQKHYAMNFKIILAYWNCKIKYKISFRNINKKNMILNNMLALIKLN
jgi:hypothetical protein